MTLIISLLWLVICVLLQVLVFNQLHLWGGVALVYLYALLKMPIETNRTMQIVTGFLTGLLIDIFCNTPGMHAFAATTTMWLRMPVLRMFIDAEDFKAGQPGAGRLGMDIFLRYALTLVSLHCILLYVVEAFSLFAPLSLVLKIFLSILLTTLVLIAVEATGRTK